MPNEARRTAIINAVQSVFHALALRNQPIELLIKITSDMSVLFDYVGSNLACTELFPYLFIYLLNLLLPVQ